MDVYEDVGLLCAIAMEVASITNIIYQRRLSAIKHNTAFNASLLSPFFKNFGGSHSTDNMVKKIVNNYVLRYPDEYQTLCGMRALINLVALSDECKKNIP